MEASLTPISRRTGKHKIKSSKMSIMLESEYASKPFYQGKPNPACGLGVEKDCGNGMW